MMNTNNGSNIVNININSKEDKRNKMKAVIGRLVKKENKTGVYYTIRKCGSNEYLIDMSANGTCTWGGGSKVVRFISRSSCEVFNDIAEGIVTRNCK